MQHKLNRHEELFISVLAVATIGVTGILFINEYGPSTFARFLEQEWLILVFILGTATTSGLVRWKLGKSVLGGLMGSLNIIAGFIFAAMVFGQLQVPATFGILNMMLQIVIHYSTIVVVSHFSAATEA